MFEILLIQYIFNITYLLFLSSWDQLVKSLIFYYIKQYNSNTTVCLECSNTLCIHPGFIPRALTYPLTHLLSSSESGAWPTVVLASLFPATICPLFTKIIKQYSASGVAARLNRTNEELLGSADARPVAN